MGEDRTREFDAFYRGTAHRVVRLVHATTGDLALAQESTQEAYARAWADWGRVRTYTDPLSWVRTVARRAAVSEWRRARNRTEAHRQVAVPEAGAGPAGEPGADHVAVVAALRALPDEIREAMVLFYVGDLSVDRIAEETGSPVGTVKARLHRGRQRLRPLLATDRPDLTDRRTDDPTREEGSRGIR
ncbi:SigE family RNA polymerase sigma factor [Phycicoccus flavus]|uniref:SigE family RNA polymerase sigma factor n=1 Tax=Phycicoccus flavus TaxID=2502783 RepID=UPI001F22B006|nr:SigE family RNA polymerase sigma factor [Phycicoccus flavus]